MNTKTSKSPKSATEIHSTNIAWIREIVEDGLKSGRVNDWERNFLANISAGLHRYGDNFEASTKQVQTLQKIESKIYE